MDSFRIDLRSVLVGTLLGDGYIIHPKIGNVYYRFKQSVIHSEYFSLVFSILKPWLTSGSPFFGSYFDNRPTKQKTYSNLTLTISTLFNSLLGIDYLASIFYYRNNEGKLIKKVPTCIKELLTPIAFALWIMDDGHYVNGGIYLNVQSFSSEDLALLLSALESNFGIIGKLRKVSNPAQEGQLNPLQRAYFSFCQISSCYY
uniref:LAGLIDADG endonuclease n=1 Tax=Powellomyces hirtus TaxID=109895 RepID=A0A4V1F1W7_9FUNG|nr:LAGLIDADG endonuclease [Powellomyces hirtus]